MKGKLVYIYYLYGIFLQTLMLSCSTMVSNMRHPKQEYELLCLRQWKKWEDALKPDTLTDVGTTPESSLYQV